MQQLLQQHIFSPNQLQQLFRTHSYYFQQLQNKVGAGVVAPPGSVPPLPSSVPSATTPTSRGERSSTTTTMPTDATNTTIPSTAVVIPKKQLEQMMSQLQEQLHVNLLQQSSFLNNPTQVKMVGKKDAQMQHTALLQQHQELLQQMQQIQRQYMMQQGLNLPQISSQQQRQQQGKSIELASILGGTGGGSNGSNMNGIHGGLQLDDENSMHPLFGTTGDGHGTCKWPSCDLAFDDFQSFLR